MLIYVYLFTLIIGAVLLGASILLGGHGADGDADIEADADADVDAEGGLDKEVSVGAHGALSGLLWSFLSLRFWTFFFAFFGLTGLVLDLLDLVGNPWATLAIALAMGGGVGMAAVAIINALGADTTGKAVEAGDYVGKTARVIVPFEGARVGKVRVDVKGSSVDLLASAVEEDAFASKEEVLIVEVEGTRAKVARVDGAKRGD